MSRMGEYSLEALAVPASGNTTVGEVLLFGDASRLGIDLSVLDQNLDDFFVQAKASRFGEYVDYITDWTTPGAGVEFASGDLATLTATAQALAVIDVSGIWSLRFRCSAAVDGANVTVAGLWANFGDDQAVVQEIIRGDSACRRSGQSGATLMDGTEQTLYESAPGVDFEFGGGVVHIPASAGAAAALKVYAKIKSGGSYLDITPPNIGSYSGTAFTFLLGQVGDNASNTRRAFVPKLNKFGLKVTLEQGTEGAGYVSVDSEWFDSLG